MKNLNLRIDKKPTKPKVVEIHGRDRQWAVERMHEILENYDRFIIIGRRSKDMYNPKGQMYTNLEPADLLYALEKAKQAVME